jgi:arylsulfatase A-like enzyme
LILTDQQRADVCGREGFPLDTTPTLDALARQGAWFDHAYTAAPICVPARVSLLTGRFPSVHHVRENAGAGYAVYGQDLFDVMRARGYATALVGKNHSHLEPDRLDHYFPLSRTGGTGEGRTAQEKAFDRWLIQPNYHVSTVPTPFPVECQCPHRAVTEAEGWIRSLDGDPFFLWLSFPEPYYSMFPPETLPPVRVGPEALAEKGFKWQWTKRVGGYLFPNYDELLPRMRANYFGMLRLIDDQVKRFVEFLDEEGLREDTLLVFLSDHGDSVGEYGLLKKGPEMPEALMRIPMFFTGPGIPALAEPRPAHVSIVDVMPTLCEAVGAPLPEGVQGRSLWPMLTGDDYPLEEFASAYGEQGVGGLHYTDADHPDPRRCLLPQPEGFAYDECSSYGYSGTMRMVRKGDWRLVMDMQGRGQLYDLARDPAELSNLYDLPEFAGVQRELLADLLAWTIRVQDPLPILQEGYGRKSDPRNYLAVRD